MMRNAQSSFTLLPKVVGKPALFILFCRIIVCLFCIQELLFAIARDKLFLCTLTFNLFTQTLCPDISQTIREFKSLHFDCSINCGPAVKIEWCDCSSGLFYGLVARILSMPKFTISNVINPLLFWCGFYHLDLKLLRYLTISAALFFCCCPQYAVVSSIMFVQ